MKIEETIESYIIDGKLYVNTTFISKHRNSTPRQIGNWIKAGLKRHKIPNISSNLFRLDEVQDFLDNNINKTKSRATRGKEISIPEDGKEDIEETVNDINGKIRQANQMLQLRGTSHDDADRIKKILDGLMQAVKLGEQTKELIPKKDTEKVIVEVIATLISGYKRDLKILPKECAMRAEEEIRAIQESAYKSNIERYQKIAKSKILSENKIYDILEIIYEMIGDEVSVDEIIKRMKNGKS